MFNPRYGAMGLVAYPYFFFAELLAPVFEAIGVLTLVVGLIIGAADFPFALLFLLVVYGYGMVLTTLTLVLDEISFSRYDKIRDRLMLLLWALVETLGYRQLTIVWRIQGILKFLLGRQDWGEMDRRGFGSTVGG